MERYDVCLWGIQGVFILDAILTIALRDEEMQRNMEHVL